VTAMETLTLRLAVQVIANHSGMAPERILNFAVDAKQAIKVALHVTYPVLADSASQTERYETTKEAAQVIEEFHGGKI
jgi:hypothetical protein